MNIDYKEFTLDNGLKVILSKRNDIPIAVLNILFRIGSKDEEEGQRGIAHLFEHLMFEGGQDENDNFDEILASRGGDSNAYTSYDSTGYYINIPSNDIETAMWLDSNRLTGIDLSEKSIETQKKVVLEEKKQVYDNAPYGSVEEESAKRLFPKNGYGIPIIGKEDDIRNMSKDTLEKFYGKYYNPSNAVIAITGDIEYDNALKLIEKYYGRIKGGESIKRKAFYDEDIKEEIIFNKEDNIQLPGRFIFYKFPGYGTKEYYTSVVLNSILSGGESSRLQKILIYEKELLNEVQTYVMGLEDVSIFSVDGFLPTGKSFEKAADAMDFEIEKVRQSGVRDEEMVKVKNRLMTSLYSKYQLNLVLAEKMSFLKTFMGDCGLINNELKKYEQVTKDDVTEFAKKYLNKENRVVLNYFPKAQK